MYTISYYTIHSDCERSKCELLRLLYGLLRAGRSDRREQLELLIVSSAPFQISSTGTRDNGVFIRTTLLKYLNLSDLQQPRGLLSSSAEETRREHASAVTGARHTRRDRNKVNAPEIAAVSWLRDRRWAGRVDAWTV